MGYNLLIHPLIKVSMMITDQFAIELGVGGPFVIKAPTLESSWIYRDTRPLQTPKGILR